MKINILGPLEIAPPSRPPDLRRAKEQSLLAVFAMSAGETLAIETLVRRVWDDGTPSDITVRTLRSYLSHVRDVVASADGEARLETTPGGYRLILDREHIDLHRFRRLRGQANALADSGETGHAASLLREAEDLWRGPALAGLPGQWIAGMRRSLEEERQAARKRRIGLELELGRHLEVMGELRLLATEFPLDDQWLTYQMLALYRSGRQAEAVRLYIEGRRRFAEVGMDLNPGLVALSERMLRHDPDLEIAPARRRALPPRAESLPNRLPGFVGRTAELASVTAVNQSPIWIIGGVGGVGKTALAVEVAHRVRDRYPDPPLYLNFHAHVPGQVTLDAADALRNLLDMLGIPPGQSRSVRELSALWQSQVATRRSVIILDDVPGRREISAILPRAGDCLTLVTTRRRMTAMPNSSLLSLEVMPEDDAVRLFSQTVGIEKAHDPAAVIKAVRLCSCLPLAITVIGGRLRDGGPTIPEWVADIAAMRAFPTGFGDLSPRLVAAFELSYEGLDNAHKEFFRRLSMNPCPDLTAGTAAVVVGVGLQEARAALAALHDRHLVERGSADRFKFHDLVRWYAQFVAERDDSGWERRAAERRLLDHYLQAVRRAVTLLYPSQRYATVGEESAGAMQPGVATREDAQRWLELEWRNILSLAGYAGKHEWKRYCADLTSALAEFLEAHGFWSEGVQSQRVALRACRETNDARREARTAGHLSLLELRTGNYAEALLRADEAVTICRSLGDSRGVAELLDRIGMIHRYTGRLRDALAHHQEALDLHQAARDKRGIADTLCHAGTAYFFLGRFAEAIANHGKGLEIYREIGDPRGVATAHNNIGEALAVQGLHRDAMANYEMALDIFEGIDAKQGLALSRHNIGRLAQSRGRLRDALGAYRAALATYREIGDLLHQACALYDIGTVYQGNELYDEALIHHQDAAAIVETLGDLHMQANAHLGIANALCGSGRYAEAQEHYNSAREMALRTEDLHQRVKALAGMATTRFLMRDVKWARVYCREALEIAQEIGVPEAETLAAWLPSLETQG